MKLLRMDVSGQSIDYECARCRNQMHATTCVPSKDSGKEVARSYKHLREFVAANNRNRSFFTPLLTDVLLFNAPSPEELRRQHLEKIQTQKALDLSQRISESFLVQPCARCQEFNMELLEISPNARSIHYKCLHCSKKMRAPAGTPEAEQVLKEWKAMVELSEKEYGCLLVEVTFATPPAPLPYEQTTRTPIPEAVRAEVWRRDGGKCVQCGSKQNLQFDHIIPVTKGGATTAKNLQLLCQSCNASKGNKI